MIDQELQKFLKQNDPAQKISAARLALVQGRIMEEIEGCKQKQAFFLFVHQAFVKKVFLGCAMVMLGLFSGYALTTHPTLAQGNESQVAEIKPVSGIVVATLWGVWGQGGE